MIYFLFFLSGISGLVYQVVWVRMFGNVFGNTVYSASIVVAVFMLGLGVGSYVVGLWADRRYLRHPDSLLRTYGQFELVIAAMGLTIAAVLPHLGALSALASSYAREPNGWYALSTSSYIARGGIAVLLLTPITLLMGGTLTLLIRHLVRSDVAIGGWRIALLYGINTAGAALGAMLTDFLLVPAWGLFATQMAAVGFNALAGLGAWYLARRGAVRLTTSAKATVVRRSLWRRRKPDTTYARKKRSTDVSNVRSVRLQPDPPATAPNGVSVTLTSLALAMTGFAALALEILWFRHFTILLGGFRAVFSLLLTLILIGMGAGSLIGGALYRRMGRPAEWLMLVQGLFVASTLFGFAAADVTIINTYPTGGTPNIGPGGAADTIGALTELWFNARPMLGEVAIPALLMGFSFPLANAVIQRAEGMVGRRAGVLYLANTAGAVFGSLLAGFVLLPALGLQMSATILAVIAALAVVPLYFASGSEPRRHGGTSVPPWPVLRTLAASLVIAGISLALWLRLPSDHVTTRALGRPPEGERRLVVSDGLTELVAVTELPGKGRTLVTNGHAMSSTRVLSQRYMRALAHIPLLSMDAPRTVLVIGFGVGNTTHAATLHPSVQHVDVADLSRDILTHASYFEEANRRVLADPKVTVHLNDGRQHLQMQPPGSYDLIVLEPPPIAYAGVSALYSREFYALARTRLTPNGYISQWLPTYQVPADTTMAMVRAFTDVFPQAVLLSGAESDLLLLGVNGSRIDIDPDRLRTALADRPDVRADLTRISLESPREIVGTFLGSSRTLADAARDAAPVQDDRPLQEYGVRSMLDFGYGVPGALVDLARVADWCPRCFSDGRPVPAVGDLDAYFQLLTLAYSASQAEIARARRVWDAEGRTIDGSGYLGAIVPESAETHNVLGITLARQGKLDGAIPEFRTALELDPENAASHWHLGAALASIGAREEATRHLARSVELDPRNSQAHSDLGLMLALQGRLDEAVDHLQQALALDPRSDEARRNLALVLERRRGTVQQ